MVVDGGGDDFAGTICSICYEDLKPVSEDLQSISVCGHVFHELCLQQWFEYCSKAKKHTCPVCKQSCRAKDACRLYFQSVGDVSEAVLPRKPLDSEEDAGVLRREVKRLEVKVSGLSSELERKGKTLEQLTEELGACKEHVKIEMTLKNEALNEKASIQSQLRVKSEELEKSTFECHRLQEENMTLDKKCEELELSNEELNAKYKELNAKYKEELMAKCSLLSLLDSRNLEKARKKITKLKARVQELETAAEVKENEYMMSLKVSKRNRCSKNVENNINSNNDVLTASKFSAKKQKKQISTPNSEPDLSGNSSKSLQFLKIENCNATENKALNFSSASRSTLSLDKKRDFISIDDDDISEFTGDSCGRPRRKCNDQYRDNAALRKPTVAESDAASGIKRETAMQGKSNLAESSRIDIDIGMANTPADAMDEDVTLLANAKQVQPMVNIIKESPLTIANPGDICFSGGLLGPDGTHRYLGKWCKRGQNSESTSAKGSSNGDLIAVGADGRGGKIKVLRTPSQTFSDDKENSASSKRLKVGPKTSSLQSQGCLQIEHFFGRINH